MSIEVKRCRSCGSAEIAPVLDLGVQSLSGTFRSSNLDHIVSGPLALVSCKCCSLVQLKHSYPLGEMYNEGYGYRSGITAYMTSHLAGVVHYALSKVALRSQDCVLDIGSNDGTLLSQYNGYQCSMLGADPVATKYLELYPTGARVITDFFTAQSYFSMETRRAKVVTSISMFYDLEDPVKFARDVSAVLDNEGVWVFEQSYLPAMLRQNSYDTICHEHLEYYSLFAIDRILKAAGLEILDVTQNEVNGGSIRVAAVHAESTIAKNVSPVVDWLMQQEVRHNIDATSGFLEFERNINRQREDLVSLLSSLKAAGKRVVGYGASTKGNVILQYCGISTDLLECIGDITPFKDGTFTPGSHIPIVSMDAAKALKPDYFLVLPWAFRNDIISREKSLIDRGAKFIFPLPFVEVVN